MTCITLSVGGCIHILLIHRVLHSAAVGCRLREALLRITLLREALLLRIALLREALLLRVTMLLRIALLLREALLLGIALLLREALLLGITLLLRIALLLGEALLLRIALLCVYIGESACAHLLSLLGMLIERVEGIGLVVSLTVIEGVGRVNVETACEFCGSSQLIGSLIIAAEEVANCRSRSQTCSGSCFVGRENYLTAAVVNACIDKESDSLVNRQER